MRARIELAFPGRGALIEQAFEESESFRDLLCDYQDCAAALERRKRLQGSGSNSQALEYAELLAELAAEIDSWLHAMNSGATASSTRGGAR